MMDSGKWMTAGLIIMWAALAVSQPDIEMEKSYLSIWVGEEVDLECGHNSADSDTRIWEKGRVSFTFVSGVAIHNDRISLVNDSTTLRIVNASSADEGTYVCTLPTQPPRLHLFTLNVKETFCEAPADLADGKYRSEIFRLFDSSRYKAWERVIYSCNSGYKLIGQAISTCSGTPKEWVPQLPRCEPEFLDPLLKRLESIEDQLSVINRRITKIENNQNSSLEGIRPQINSTLDKKHP